mgnify:CR=1 FL=1
MNIVKQRATVLSNEMISAGIYSMWLENRAASLLAKPGQFISVYCEDKSRLLPRPISICEVDKQRGALRIVFRVAGAGTDEFAHMTVGQGVDIMGPLGNGYTLQTEGKAILVGGGIGIPPMLGLAKKLYAEGKKVIAVLGYRDAKNFLAKEFEEVAEVVIATEDGSVGVKGNVIDAIKAKGLTADTVYSCGPTPMLRGVKAFAESAGIACQISLEEKMACGIGACLACVCKTKEKDHHSNVNNARICKDGPVFMAQDIEL